MRTIYLFFFVCFCIGLYSQAIYKSSDPGSDWSSSNLSHIKSDNSTPSSGYSESNSSPSASGSNNAIFSDCTPPSTNYSLTSPVISTIGKKNIRIGFGQRHTVSFTSSVVLEWSSNGSSWNNISSNVVSGGTGVWAVSIFDLSPSADNLLTLQFRFSFSTSAAATNNCPVGGNFKIDDFWVGSNFKLPIQLSSFSVDLIQYPVLQWTTLSESNSGYFFVERSRDGNNFNKIAQITCIPSAHIQTDYIYTDFTPLPGANYYRLKQIDLDGSPTIFPVKSIVVPVREPSVYPTIFSTKLYIEIPELISKNCHWNMSDLYGRVVQAGFFIKTNTAYCIDTDRLMKGTYLLGMKSDMYSKSFKVFKM